MSDRLKDLQRQRALAQEQLDWLDREIARESGGAAVPVRPAAPVARVRSTPPAQNAVEAARMADEILSRYRAEAASTPASVKRGCYVYFAVALVLLVAGVVAMYFYYVGRK